MTPRPLIPARTLIPARIVRALALTTLTLLLAAAIAGAAQLSVRDEGHLRYVTSYGSQLIDEGPARGTMPGKVRVWFVYNGEPNVGARFTIYGRDGTISGRGRARLSSPTSLTPSFRGAFAITGGSGRYSRARGGGELYGVFMRHGYGLIVQTIGTLRY